MSLKQFWTFMLVYLIGKDSLTGMRETSGLFYLFEFFYRFFKSVHLRQRTKVFNAFNKALIVSSIPESSPNLCVNSSFSYVVLSTLLLSSRDLTEWSLVYHSTLSYQRFYDLHSIHYDHLEGLHQLI